MVTVESSRSIMLTWDRPLPEKENGLLVHYHVIVIEIQIHYMDNGTKITEMQTYLNITYNVSEGRSQLIDDLHPGYNYTVRIAAATGTGIGPFSEAITVRTNTNGELSCVLIKLNSGNIHTDFIVQIFNLDAVETQNIIAELLQLIQTTKHTNIVMT